MAITFQTPDSLLIIPGAYAKFEVQTSNSGLATTGVLALVGESVGGPDYTQEADIQSNFYGPDALADVITKYGSGPLVDAFKAASVPANDPDIVGAPGGFILVKTNPSAKASSALTKIAGGTYSTLYDKNYGKAGNLINYTVTATSEVIPTTGPFTLLLPIAAYDISLRSDGAAAVSTTLGALSTPTAFVATVDALAGVACTGGANRNVLAVGNVGESISLAISGNSVTLTLVGTWNTTPSTGDTLYIDSGSAVQGATNKNRGSYVVTAATSTTIAATKLLDDAGAPGSLTSPEAVSSTPIASSSDVQGFAPVTISLEAGTVIDGVGKSLEVNELTSNPDRLSNVAYNLNPTKVTWVSKTSAPKLLTSNTEYSVTVNESRDSTNTQNSFSVGGKVALSLGYTGTTATVTVTATTLSTNVTGGSGANITVNLADYPTLNDLAMFISSQAGYTASATAALGFQPPSKLDHVTGQTMATTFGNKTLRLKNDAASFLDAVNNNSVLMQLNSPSVRTAAAGLPAAVATNTFLSGGTLGGTTDAVFSNAMTALKGAKLNFLIPLFSRDASADITDGLTDSTSTYTIDGVNSSAKTHVIQMSTLKTRRNRLAFCSKRDTFANVKLAANNLASARVSLTFQDVKNLSAAGSVVQYQSWMGAALAAGMQAAGFYRAIFNKGINCNGFLQAAKDFNPLDQSQVEDALTNGLLVGQTSNTGGFSWISDQTTYIKDSNFVFNSIQAMYVADTIALTCAQRMEKAFVGKSVADITASVVLAFLKAVMQDFLRLKLISASDDAPSGFKNAIVNINGPVVTVNFEAKLAGAIYFIPITFAISQVSQTASTAG